MQSAEIVSIDNFNPELVTIAKPFKTTKVTYINFKYNHKPFYLRFSGLEFPFGASCYTEKDKVCDNKDWKLSTVASPSIVNKMNQLEEVVTKQLATNSDILALTSMLGGRNNTVTYESIMNKLKSIIKQSTNTKTGEKSEPKLSFTIVNEMIDKDTAGGFKTEFYDANGVIVNLSRNPSDGANFIGDALKHSRGSILTRLSASISSVGYAFVFKVQQLLYVSNGGNNGITKGVCMLKDDIHTQSSIQRPHVQVTETVEDPVDEDVEEITE